MSEEARIPPSNKDAERSLLGCMLRDNRVIAEIVGLVRAENFYVFAHECVFRAIIELADKGKEADVVTVAEWLMKAKKLDEVGGPAYLAELWDAAPSTGRYRQYAEIIRDRAIRRDLGRVCAQISETAFDLGTDTGELLADAERRVLAISELGIVGEAVDLQTALGEAYVRLDSRQGNDQMSGVPTGFADLDALLCGFQDSELVIVGARPSVGKTAFGLALARHASVDEELPIFFVSLEQARVELAERLLCCQGRVDSHRLRRGYLSTQDQGDIIVAGETLGKAKMFIDDTPGQTMLRIAANARRLKQRHGIRMVVIDYLQLIQSESYRASRQEQVGETSRRLKFLARELKLPVIALAQVNRGLEDRADKRPKLSDLRESGSIEQDADTVIMLHRPEVHEPGRQEGMVEVIVAKQRNGPTGTVNLMYVKQYMRFENFAVEYSNH